MKSYNDLFCRHIVSIIVSTFIDIIILNLPAQLSVNI